MEEIISLIEEKIAGDFLLGGGGQRKLKNGRDNLFNWGENCRIFSPHLKRLSLSFLYFRCPPPSENLLQFSPQLKRLSPPDSN